MASTCGAGLVAAAAGVGLVAVGCGVVLPPGTTPTTTPVVELPLLPPETSPQLIQVQSRLSGSKTRLYHLSASSKRQSARSASATASAGENQDPGKRRAPGS